MPSVEGLELDPHHLMTFIGADSTQSSRTPSSRRLQHPGTERHGAISRRPEHEPAVDMKFVYRNMSSAGLRDGVMETMTAGPLTVSTVAPGEGEIRVRDQNRSRPDRMDVAAAAHIVDDREYRDGRGDGIWRPIVSRVGYSGFSGQGPDGVTFKLDEVAIENIDGRQPEKPFTAAWDKIIDPTIPEDAKSDMALESLRDIYSAWRVGTFRMEGLAVDAPAENTAVLARRDHAHRPVDRGHRQLHPEGAEREEPGRLRLAGISRVRRPGLPRHRRADEVRGAREARRVRPSTRRRCARPSRRCPASRISA